MTQRLHRRRFLQQTAVAAGTVAGAQLLGAPYVLAQKPSDKLRTVVIGCANQGMASISAAVTEKLVALVDVDDNHMAGTLKAIQELPDTSAETKASPIKQYYDYRKMFDELDGQIDAVFVATPDHHHYAATIRAIMAGKAVYTEKPLAHTIDECRKLAAAAKKYKVVTQMGNQGHSGEGLRILQEYLNAGAIGNVLETYSWAPSGRGGRGGRLPTKPVPAGLHWDEWIGPMPFRDYHDELHPLLWRSWWMFGGGSVGDWGCHNLDGPFTALNLGSPTTVEALDRSGGSDERFPLRNSVRWTFPARGNMPPVKVHWFDGYADDFDPNQKDEDPVAALKAQNRPPIVAELEQKYKRELKNGGTLYVGEKGIMYTGNYAGSPRILPEEKHRAFPRPAKTLPRVKGKTHALDFLQAAKEGYKAASDFQYAAAFTEVVLLGCIAERAGVGKKVEWDSQAMQVTNLPELNAMVKRAYRTGWDV